MSIFRKVLGRPMDTNKDSDNKGQFRAKTAKSAKIFLLCVLGVSAPARMNHSFRRALNFCYIVGFITQGRKEAVVFTEKSKGEKRSGLCTSGMKKNLCVLRFQLGNCEDV
jgi:hypothetical protein